MILFVFTVADNLKLARKFLNLTEAASVGVWRPFCNCIKAFSNLIFLTLCKYVNQTNNCDSTQSHAKNQNSNKMRIKIRNLASLLVLYNDDQ